MKAQAGDAALCRARTAEFIQRGRLVRRGVISYYAALTFPRVRTAANWFEAMTTLAAKGSEEKLDLQMYPGAAAFTLPGRARQESAR